MVSERRQLAALVDAVEHVGVPRMRPPRKATVVLLHCSWSKFCVCWLGFLVLFMFCRLQTKTWVFWPPRAVEFGLVDGWVAIG